MWASFVDILQDVFLIRAANEKLKWGLVWVDFVRCCAIKGAVAKFDRMTFIRRYLTRNNRLKNINEFIAVYEQLKNITAETCKHRMHGHDFFELFGWYVSKKFGHGGNRFRHPDVIRAVIFPAVIPESLVTEEPFRTLLKTYKC